MKNVTMQEAVFVLRFIADTLKS